MTTAVIGVLFVDLKFKPPNTKIIQDTKCLLKNAQLIVFLIVILVTGI